MKTTAKESAKVRKFRRKLQKQLDNEHALISESAIKQMKLIISQWISRHSKERVSLAHKSITLFDENQHSAAPESKYVQALLRDLRNSALSLKQTDPNIE